MSDLFKKNKEALLWNLISNVRDNIDVNQIKKSSVSGLAQLFDLSRCYILEYDENEKALPIDKYSEYLSSADEKSMVDVDLDRAYDFNYWTDLLINLYKNNKVDFVFVNDSRKYIEDNKLSGTKIEKYSNDFNLKSGVAFSFFEKNKIKMMFVANFLESRIFTKDEIHFIQTFVKQVYIGIKQAKLYESQKNKIKFDTLLRKITESLRSNLNVDEILNILCDETARAFNVQRATIVEFLDINDPSKYVIRREYKTNNVIKGLSNSSLIPKLSNFWNKKLTKQKSPIAIDNIQNSNAPKYFKNIYRQLGVKSIIGMVLKEEEDYIGGIVLSEYNRYRHWTPEEIQLLSSIAGQVCIAMNQAKLYTREKQTAEKELLLRKIIETLRSTLDAKEFKNRVVYEIGKALKADRVFIIEYDSCWKKYIPVEKEAEFLSSPELTSFVGANLSGTSGFEFIQTHHEAKKDIIYSDIEKFIIDENMLGSDTEKFLKHYDIKSLAAMVLTYGDEFLGNLVIQYTQSKHEFGEDDLKFIKILATQCGVSLYQSKTYLKQKKIAKNEALLRQIVEKIRSKVGVNEVKKEIVNQIAMILQPDRVLFTDYDEVKGDYTLPKENEYRSSKRIKSLARNHFTKHVGFSEYIRDVHLEGNDIIFNDIDRYLIDKNLQGSGIEAFYKHYNYGSSAAINIYYGESFLGNLVITYERKNAFEEDTINLIKAVAERIGIAINQAVLYEKEKQAAQRERLMWSILSKSIGKLDINGIVKEIGINSKADRCYFVEVDVRRMKGMSIDADAEYLSSPDVKSVVGYEFPASDVDRFVEMYLVQQNLIVFDYEKLLEENKEEFKGMIKYVKMFGLKSGIGIPFFYMDKLLAVLVIEYVKEKVLPNEDELDFLRIVGNQVGIAFNQMQLYQNTKKLAEKESILRSIISEIKLTRDLGQAYNKLLRKIAEIFGLNRVLFLESSEINYEELNVKYEYVIEREDLSVNNLVFPPICKRAFLSLIHNLKPLVINDVIECHPEQTSAFFDKYRMKALLAVPLVKYNKETKVLGFIVLCSENARIWTGEEISLIESISNSVVSVIWEITNFTEIEELRNAFVLTLAHDIQVPFVGEKRALEYLLKVSDEKNKEIIEELIENNASISNLLTKSVDIYNYESGKKKLHLFKYNIIDILLDSIDSQQQFADSKSVKIHLTPIKENLFVDLDKTEIMKVFNTLLKNAIQHSKNNENVEVKYHKQSNFVVISFINKGETIPAELQEKIFKRYEMAQVIERKIGGGTELFLAKKIVEAHKGFLWFKSKENEGTTFYTSLPLTATEHQL